MSALPPEPSDHELVRRSLAGEARAFAQLVEKHQRLVYGVALSGARDVSQAEDVAQEAFVEAWRDLPRLRDPSRVGSWIAGIARNLARNWGRGASRRQRREVATLQAAQHAVPTPLDTTLDRETQGLVRAALAEVPDAYREVLVLYYVHGRSVAEVASGLGISEDLVKQRMSRGRRALRASIEARVEGALETLGPSKGFTAAVMVAVSAAMVREAAAAGTAGAAGKVIVGMQTSKLAALGAAIVVAGGVGWYGLSSGARDEPAPAIATQTPAAAAAPRESSEPSGAKNVRKLASREAREKLLEQIRRAQERKLAAETTAPAVAAQPRGPAWTHKTIDRDSPAADREYVRDAVRGLLPLLVECYTAALEAQPTLAGKLVVSFTIEGEPGIGGLVTESAVDLEKSEIQDPDFGQCVQETMFALEIDPPADGGSVKVTYPFLFQPKPET